MRATLEPNLREKWALREGPPPMPGHVGPAEKNRFSAPRNHPDQRDGRRLGPAPAWHTAAAQPARGRGRRMNGQRLLPLLEGRPTRLGADRGLFSKRWPRRCARWARQSLILVTRDRAHRANSFDRFGAALREYASGGLAFRGVTRAKAPIALCPGGLALGRRCAVGRRLPPARPCFCPMRISGV